MRPRIRYSKYLFDCTQISKNSWKKMDESIRSLMRQHLALKKDKTAGLTGKDKVKAMKQQKELHKTQPQSTSSTSDNNTESKDATKTSAPNLPQGFFDDPIEDLKAQGIIKNVDEFKELRKKHDQDELESFMTEIDHISHEYEGEINNNTEQEASMITGEAADTVEVLAGNNLLDTNENDILQYAYITKLATLYHQSESVMKKYQLNTNISNSNINKDNAVEIEAMLEEAQTLARQEEVIVDTNGMTLSDTNHNTEDGGKRKKQQQQEDLTSMIMQQLRKQQKAKKRKVDSET